MNPDDLRAQIALVSQEPVLFDGSITDNIRYGRLDAAQADVNEAARKVEAWQFINALPQGMNTRVGDRGMQLSGGQKVGRVERFSKLVIRLFSNAWPSLELSSGRRRL